ncbi:MAG TPA: response regulator FixJ [Rhodomicrobium sp.]|nr:response regulator FixJ [Rhodomicrobium sp.]
MAPDPPVYIIDDDEAIRDSLSIQLDAAGFKVTTFASGLDFLAKVSSLEPGCLISDVRMPEIDGLELQNRLAAMKLNFPVIIITGHGDISLAVRAMRAGAVDFVEKPFSEETILQSIRLAQCHFEQVSRNEAAGETARARIALLTPRERDVFDGLVAGRQNKVIAYDLSISPRTVEIHRARVLEKMQARNLAELVRLALAAGVEIKS